MYPPCFNELMVNYMSEQVVGLKGVPKADAKAHFNDTRKTAKNEMEVNPHSFPFFPLASHFFAVLHRLCSNARRTATTSSTPFAIGHEGKAVQDHRACSPEAAQGEGEAARVRGEEGQVHRALEADRRCSVCGGKEEGMVQSP